MAPGKSGLHARGEGECVLALESREGSGVWLPGEQNPPSRREAVVKTWCWLTGDRDPIPSDMKTSHSLLPLWSQGSCMWSEDKWALRH